MNKKEFITNFAYLASPGTSLERVMTREAATRASEVLMYCLACKESRLRRQREAVAGIAKAEESQHSTKYGSVVKPIKRPVANLPDDDLLIDDETARTLLRADSSIVTSTVTDVERV